MKLQRIIVALKPWERGLPIAADHARQLAQHSGAKIAIVGSVFDAAVSAGRDRSEPGAERTQHRTVAAARANLERLATSIREWGAAVTTSIVWGVPPYEAILAAARDWDADLLVVGTHERGALHARFTDTDWQLMRRTQCPLLLVKGAVFGGYRTVLAAVDHFYEEDEGRSLDRAVMAATRCVADACGSGVRAVCPYPGADVDENAQALDRSAVDELAAEFGVARSDVDLIGGSAPEVIIGAAAHRRAELVVVGNTQRGRFASAVLGNTAELVVGELPCDVLIVPALGTPPVAPRIRSKVG